MRTSVAAVLVTAVAGLVGVLLVGGSGPGAQSTLIPVSGAPVSSKPSVKRVVAFQYAAVPR